MSYLDSHQRFRMFTRQCGGEAADPDMRTRKVLDRLDRLLNKLSIEFL